MDNLIRSTPLILLFLFTVNSVPEVTASRSKKALNLHHHMTEGELQKYFGVSSHSEVPEYDIAESFPSNERGHIVRHLRHRRNIPDSSSPLYYNVKAFGRSLHLNLTADNSVTSPSLVVQTVHENGSVTISNADDTPFYVGHVTSHPGSRVAVSNDKGLTGLIHLLDDSFFIHPLPDHLAKAHGNVFGGQSHVIYRRSRTETHHDALNENQLRVMNRRSNEEGLEEYNGEHKVLEMTLAADKGMIDDYKPRTARHLLLLAHIARSLFLEETFGSIKLNLIINGIVLIREGFGYDQNTAGITTKLGAIARWAKTNLPVADSDPGHPDIIVLLSPGHNTGGVAYKNSMCSYEFPAAVTKNYGLASAIVIAHETMHTFNVPHDGGEAVCPDGKNIMSSALSVGVGALTWSVCSREAIQVFLANPEMSSCLNDAPPKSSVIHEPAEFFSKLGGEMFDKDQQCKMIFGQVYIGCSWTYASCENLKCSRIDSTSSCIGYNTPPAKGTRCGPRHWCLQGKCIDNGKPAIDGEWSPWSSEYSPCSRTCGGAVQWRSRTCSNPPPSNAGKTCEGLTKGHLKMCNLHACSVGAVDYRLLQCKRISSKYTSVYYETDPCRLNCVIGNEAWPEGIVKDGTRCSSDVKNRNVCVEGKCRVTACDNSLDSGVQVDRCGVCDGDGSSCSIVSRVYEEKCPGFGPADACTFLEVPVGATDVTVQKKVVNRNLLSVKDQHGTFIFRIPSWNATVDIAGTRVYYYHDDDAYRDSVFIPGPTSAHLYIIYVPVTMRENHGVAYTYYLTGQSTPITGKDVQWTPSSWGACSETCAGGVQKRGLLCTRKDDKTYVAMRLCLSDDNKPEVTKTCNTHACPPSWYASGWQQCSKSCGTGSQTRQIVCRQKVSAGQYTVLPSKSCTGNKPTGLLTQQCNMVACPPEWVPTDWSRCSVTCGGGTMMRTMDCKRRDSSGHFIDVHSHLCHYATKPVTKKPCNQNVICQTPWSYHPLGCYKDSKPRALPYLIINLRDFIDWTDPKKTIDACAKYVREHTENKVFAIQFYGECWTGKNGEETYMQYGPSENCWNGIGLEKTLFAYRYELHARTDPEEVLNGISINQYL